MRRILTWMIGMVVGGGVVFTAFQYHVVRTDQRFLVVPKQQSDWREAYVDVRGWSIQEWGEHARLSQNLVAAGHGDIVARSATDRLFRGFFNSFRESADEEAPAEGKSSR